MIKIKANRVIVLLSIIQLIVNIFFWYNNSPIMAVEDNASETIVDIFSNSVWFYNAPFVTWIMKAMISVFGIKNIDLSLIFFNCFFLFLALYFIYKIGCYYKDEKNGLLSVILFFLTPAVYIMSRRFGHQDWHVMVAMTANIYLLIKSKCFKDRIYSIFYAISISFGLLIKDSFILYFIAPFIYTIIKTILNKISLNKIINISFTIIIPLLAAGYHYFMNYGIHKVFEEITREPVPIFSYDNLSPLTLNLWDTLLTPPIFLLFIVSFIWFVIYYKNENKYIVILTIVFPYFVLIFIRQCARIHHVIPLVPSIILIISIFLSNIKKTMLKKYIFLVLFLLTFIQYILSLNLSVFEPISNFFNKSVQILGIDIMYYNKNNLLLKTGEKSVLKMTEYLKQKKINKYKIIIFYFGHHPYNIHSINACLLLNGFNTFVAQHADEDDYKLLKNFDVVMFPTMGLKNNDEFVNSLIQMYLELNFVSKEDVKSFRQEIKKNIGRIFKEIRENYKIIDNFYLCGTDNQYEIILFGKKNKFTEIKKQHLNNKLVFKDIMY